MMPEGKLVTRGSLLLDAILVVAFFLYIYTVIVPHVQSHNPRWQIVWGGLTASCLTAVFWLCIQMFRVVLRHQLRLNRARAQRSTE